MTVWIPGRLVQAGCAVIAMTLIVFASLHLIGNPIDLLLPPDADAAERARMIAAFGLDRPLALQYLAFVERVLHGDFGLSFVYGTPAVALVLSRLPATLELAVLATALSIGLGIPLGLAAALRQSSPVGQALTGLSTLSYSLPAFWTGLLLILVFSVVLGWLPSTGRGQTVAMAGGEWSFVTLDGLRHLCLPVLNLAVFKTALILRLTKSGAQGTLVADHIRFARARGLTTWRIVFVHILRTILVPIIAVLGVEFGATVAFSVVTESIFAWPGMGSLFVESLHTLDRPVIVVYLATVVLIFIVSNMAADVLVRLADPRIRTGPL
ncbi:MULTISPECIES: ABC transporter permease [unclassified Methylobacterium]|jgi:peptide/nickel transport system permease protein|uniref:ABC transporter permease n=1 Tax=unclassified Methylobacterium TaxID=2615210 RepID=UPI0013521F59|nr:ABC transporter permease [Methylobacterium sp. 2A]MWV22369.1 ABC transporter permease [Methylobacterium sp. 2A]